MALARDQSARKPKAINSMTPTSKRPGITIAIAFALGVLIGVFWHRSLISGRLTFSPDDSKAGLRRLSSAFTSDRFVAYSPSQFNPTATNPEPIGEDSIRDDLRVVRTRFSAIVTYSCDPRMGLDRIVPVAHDLDMRVIVGVWDIHSVVEIETSVRLARGFPDTVVGIIVGNETLSRGGEWEPLEAAIKLVKSAAPGMPISTSEPISGYGNDALCHITDLHSPNVHWIFESKNREDVPAALDWLVERTQALRGIYPKPLLVKEHGMPSGPEPFTEALQSIYWA